MSSPDFGILLRSHRGAAELTQEQLAERCGLSVQAIRKLEHGGRRPQARNLDRLAYELHLTPEQRAEFIAAGMARDDPPLAEVAAMTPRLEAAAEALAGMVRSQWRIEAASRLLLDPVPLTVRWSPAGAGLGDHPEVSGRLGRHGVGSVEEVAAEFRRLCSRRLVVLGRPGAGKTSLLILLTLGLLDEQRPGRAVPVPLLLSSWDAGREPLLEDWVRRRLLEEYPSLRVRGADVAGDLVRHERVLPLLDGLDELPLAARRKVIAALRRDGPKRPLVLACRLNEYDELVAGSGPLRAAAVVTLEEAEPDAVVDYLRRSAPPGQNPERWEPVIAALGAQDPGPAAAALRTPLMVSLARMVYERDGTDPAELVNEHRLSSREAVEEHLLDALIPAVLRAEEARLPSGRAPWSPDDAGRWLRFLAKVLYRRGTPDLAWWRLAPSMSSWTRYVVFTFLVVLGPVNLLFPGDGRWQFVASGPLVALLVLTLDRRPVTVVVRLDRTFLSTLARRGARQAWSMLKLGLPLIPLLGLFVGISIEPRAGVVIALFVGLVFLPALAAVVGLATGLIYALLQESDDLPDPARALRTDRVAFVVVVLTVGLALPAGIELGLGLMDLVVLAAFHKGIGLAARFAPLLAHFLPPFYAVAAVIAAGGFAWSRYEVTRAWFAITGRLPWRLMAFLRDAHRLGILRQFGAVYQFRHAELRDRLAALELQATKPARRQPQALIELLAGIGRVVDAGMLQATILFARSVRTFLPIISGRLAEARAMLLCIAAAIVIVLVAAVAETGWELLGAIAGWHR